MLAEPVTPSRLLRKRDASERLGVSQRQLDVFIAQGRLAVRRFGPRCVRVDERELQRFIDSDTVVA